MGHPGCPVASRSGIVGKGLGGDLLSPTVLWPFRCDPLVVALGLRLLLSPADIYVMVGTSLLSTGIAIIVQAYPGARTPK